MLSKLHETWNMELETQNGQLSPHFALSEFTKSATAKKRGIANVPSEQEIENLRRLCQGTLEPLREALRLPIIITSGYRCKALNNILGRSSKNSQHMAGCAADFYVGQSPVQSSRIKATELQNPISKMVSGFKSLVSSLVKSVTKAEKPASHRELLIKAFRTIILDERIDYDQLILYPTFIHVSYVSRERNRRAILIGQRDGKLGYGRLSLKNALKIE